MKFGLNFAVYHSSTALFLMLLRPRQPAEPSSFLSFTVQILE